MKRTAKHGVSWLVLKLALLIGCAVMPLVRASAEGYEDVDLPVVACTTTVSTLAVTHARPREHVGEAGAPFDGACLDSQSVSLNVEPITIVPSYGMALPGIWVH